MLDAGTLVWNLRVLFWLLLLFIFLFIMMVATWCEADEEHYFLISIYIQKQINNFLFNVVLNF